MIKRTRNKQKIQQAIQSAKETLLNAIAKHFGISPAVRLVAAESIYMGAQGSFEGGEIKINRNLPLFWQLLILEHEIGHYMVLAGHPSENGKVFRSFHTHQLSSEEQRAWEWVEKNPIAPGSFVDQAVREYIAELKRIGKTYGHVDDVMRVGWWY